MNCLQIANLMDPNNDAGITLANVYKAILETSRQVPVSHRADAHRVEFLHRALIVQEWVRDPLLRVATNELTFQELYSELEAAVQLDKKLQLANAMERMTKYSNISTNADGVVPINFSGQVRYQGKKSNFGSKPRVDPLAIVGCLNCDDPGHRAKDCPKPKNYDHATACKL